MAITFKVILPKIIFDFIVARLPENVKILPRWIYDFCLQQRCKGDGLQKRNIYPAYVSLTIKGFRHLKQFA